MKGALKFCLKLLKIILAVIVALVIIFIIAVIVVNIVSACRPPETTFEIYTEDDLNTIHVITEGESYYLKNDLEMFAHEGFFRSSWTPWLTDQATFDGCGHTITIKGDPGTLAESVNGFFRQIVNSLVKDLTIVYQLELDVNEEFGGLSSAIENSTIDNVHIIYSKGVEYIGKNSSSFGGLAARVKGSSVINNCSVKGEIKASSCCVGGLIGSLGSSAVVTASRFDGGIESSITDLYATIDKISRAFCGGLVGVNYGLIRTSKVVIDKVNVAFSAATYDVSGHGEVGSLVGYCYGTIKDCYVDIAKEASFCASKGNTFFSRDLCSGLLCGHLSGGAHLDNIYIDASKWAQWDSKTAGSKHSLNALFGSSESTNVTNIYFVDTSHNIVLKEQIDVTINKNTEKLEMDIDSDGSMEKCEKFEYHAEVDTKVGTLSISLRYTKDEEGNYCILEESPVTVGDVTVNVLPSSSDQSNTRIEYLFSNDNIYLWQINVIFNYTDMTAHLQILRSIKSSERNEFVLLFGDENIVDDYFDVVMDDHADIIGASTYYWTRDDLGKPILIIE